MITNLSRFSSLIIVNGVSLQLSVVSRLKHDHFVEMMGYCLEQNNRILVYQFATMGSLHDVLHGMYIKIPIRYTDF